MIARRARVISWLAALLLLLVPGVCLAAPTLVQSKNVASADDVNSINISFDTPPTAGNLLIAYLGNRTPAGSVTRPAGWSNVIQVPGATPGGSLAYKVAGVAEPSNVSFSATTATRLGLHIYEYSGIANALYRGNGLNSGSGTSLTSGSVTTTGIDELVFTGFTTNVATTFGSWTNGFTEHNDFQNTGSNRSTYAGADVVAATPGSYSTTATTTSAADWFSITARFTTGTSISGSILEDVNGDSGLGDAVGASGVRVRLYADANDSGTVDTGDTYLGLQTTGVGGAYSFTVDMGATGDDYLIAVNSKDVPPSDGLNGGFAQTDLWAEQTYGDDATTPALDLAARLGGLAAGTSDDFNTSSTSPSNNAYQHLARVDASAGDVSGIDFAFSFRAVSHDGDGDDDTGENRTVQGSLRQLVQNSNAIVGAPTVAVPAGTYTLTETGSGEDAAVTGDLDITQDLTLVGTGSTAVFVDGNASDRIFDVHAGVAADISAMTIRNGLESKGAGIRTVATLTLTDAVLHGHVASADGGAVHGEAALVSVDVTGCELHTNQAKNGAGFFFKGTTGSLTFADVTVRDSTATATGGGILINNCNGSTTISDTTLNGNDAVNGGGILLKTSTTPTLTNVTISGNTASGAGGGVRIESGAVELLNVTITDNDAPAGKGAGIFQSGGTIQLQNTIVADNTTGEDCGGTIDSAGSNLDGDGSCAFSGPGDISSGTAALEPLADNGGPTFTHALAVTSDAVDAGLNAGSPATDQRGQPRPFDGDGDTIAVVDIGAYENQQAPDLVSGQVLEDLDGDGALGDAVATTGVRVRLYEDANDNGVVDTGDTSLGEETTDGSGAYSFAVDTAVTGTDYLVAVDSKTVPPSDGFNVGFVQTDLWAEQTYGDDASTPALDLAVRIGGDTAGTSDDVDPASTDPADNVYQHLARVDLSGGSVSGVDFAFSFRAVSHEADRDDDTGENRTAQGSLRQLIQNANAIDGAPLLDIPAGTYTLALTGSGEDAALTGDLDVTDDVTLAGASPSATMIDGNRTDRVFDLFATTVQFSTLTVEKGDAQGDHGGGIRTDDLSSLTLADTMIRDNDGNRGGGIQASGLLIVSASTIYGNRADQGGGIQAPGSGSNVMLTNVTISGNDAVSRGGGLEIDQATLTNVTITANTSADGGGLYRRGSQPISVGRTIIAGNPSGGDCTNIFTSAGYNLDGDTTCSLGGTGDISGGSANLGSLTDNGGPTLTHELLTASDAVDAVTAGCPPPATDQRGIARPLGAACDIGAYELDGRSISGNVYHDANANGSLDAGESGIGAAWVKLLSGGSVIDSVQADPDSGAYTFSSVLDGSYTLIVDDNDNAADSTATEPVNWLFENPATGSLAVTVAGADVTDRDLGLTFDFDLAADCACAYEDGLLLQRTITVDGDMSDWGPVLSDGDNNACDATDDTDRDHPVQSSGRNLLRTAVTFDATYFSMWIQRVGSSNNNQNFIFYADTNVDGILQAGEPVIAAKWNGSNGVVVLELYAYDDLGSGGDSMLDGSGLADGYSMPGDLTFVKTLNLPDGAGQGSTSGATDGTQMEWTIEWSELGVPSGSAIGWHVSSTNSTPASANLASKIDDNLGGCGGQCSGSNQFSGVQASPGTGNPGETVYVSHSFTNTGNGPDLFDFAWTSTGDFVPTSVVFYRDLGTVGQYDPGVDTLIVDTDSDSDPDTGNLAAAASFDMLVAIELPGPPSAGSVTVTTTATSNFVPGCGETVTPQSGSVDDAVEIAYVISGTVFEDVNYGGGPGRDLATAAADAPSFSVGRGNATVELYDADGDFVAGTTTQVADGSYEFTGLLAAEYTVRVVNDTVTSSRPGSDGTELGAQTYRVDGDAEGAGDGAKMVGGELPSHEDAAANSGAQALTALQGTDIDGDGITEWTQSIVTVDTSAGDVSGVDFGFNFDVIVNTNDAGQGSLRQFVLNSNLLN